MTFTIKEKFTNENGWLLDSFVATVDVGVDRFPDEKVINFTLNLAAQSKYHSTYLMEKN